MDELIKYSDYKEYKAAMDNQWRENEKKAGELVEGFAVIGYLLKQARDTDILKDSGYKNVNEFAEAEYHIDKTIVSRYIGINDRFSELGNSRQLKENYRGIGYAKLILMLQMPDEINEEITPAYSKSEVQAIKDEVDEEKKRTDLEVLMEGEDKVQQSMDSNLEKAIHQLGREEPELYVRLYEGFKKGKKDVYEEMAPAEEAIYSIRIPGIGRMMMCIKGVDRDISLVNVRSNEKELYQWDWLLSAIGSIMDYEKSAEDSWESVYGAKFPKKTEVAPVQSSKGEKRPSVKKPQKVIKAKPEPEMQKPNPVKPMEEKNEEDSGREVRRETEKIPVKTEEETEKHLEVAPVQQHEEAEKTEPKTLTVDEAIYSLRNEAEEYLKKIREALDENKYFLAKVETKHLLETLGEIVEAIDRKPMPGQIGMTEITQNPNAEE